MSIVVTVSRRNSFPKNEVASGVCVWQLSHTPSTTTPMSTPARVLNDQEKLTLRLLVQHVARTFFEVDQVVAIDLLTKHPVCVMSLPSQRCHGPALLNDCLLVMSYAIFEYTLRTFLSLGNLSAAHNLDISPLCDSILSVDLSFVFSLKDDDFAGRIGSTIKDLSKRVGKLVNIGLIQW